jgi:hypothetical protein
VTAAGEFEPRGHSGAGFAGGLIGGDIGDAIGSAAGGIGAAGGYLAGTLAHDAAGLPGRMVVGVSETTVYGRRRRTRPGPGAGRVEADLGGLPAEDPAGTSASAAAKAYASLGSWAGGVLGPWQSSGCSDRILGGPASTSSLGAVLMADVDGIGDLGSLSRSQLAVALPDPLTRALVATTLGIGVGSRPERSGS